MENGRIYLNFEFFYKRGRISYLAEYLCLNIENYRILRFKSERNLCIQANNL